MKEYFNHYKIQNETKRPYVVTVCLLEESLPLSRGVAICSPLDQYNRKRGNQIARGRAVKAIMEKRSYSPIRKELRAIVPFDYKGEYFFNEEAEAPSLV